jgi:hypothetical protein
MDTAWHALWCPIATKPADLTNWSVVLPPRSQDIQTMSPAERLAYLAAHDWMLGVRQTSLANRCPFQWGFGNVGGKCKAVASSSHPGWHAAMGVYLDVLTILFTCRLTPGLVDHAAQQLELPALAEYMAPRAPDRPDRVLDEVVYSKNEPLCIAMNINSMAALVRDLLTVAQFTTIPSPTGAEAKRAWTAWLAFGATLQTRQERLNKQTCVFVDGSSPVANIVKRMRESPMAEFLLAKVAAIVLRDWINLEHQDKILSDAGRRGLLTPNYVCPARAHHIQTAARTLWWLQTTPRLSNLHTIVDPEAARDLTTTTGAFYHLRQTDGDAATSADAMTFLDLVT